MEVILAHSSWFVILAMIFGLYMTWGIGANDVANAMGTSVGSGAVSLKQAVLIAAVFEFAGAFIAGGHVTQTIRKGIIDPGAIAGSPEVLMLGMLAALLASGVWLMIATARGWPVSTTHSIVGAVVGFGVVSIGFDAVRWEKIGQIVLSWVLSPVLGGIFAYVLMVSIRALILNAASPFRSARRWGPLYVFIVGFIISLVTLFKGLSHMNIDLTIGMSFLIATLIGLLVALIGWLLISRVRIDRQADRDFHFASVEKVFAPMMLFTACATAFAHGSNDVANGIGPMAAVVGLIEAARQGSTDIVHQNSALPLWTLALGGVGIVVGLATLGYRVMRTIGTRITELTPTRGYCATLAAASTVVLASRTGLPVSTTHIAVGAVIGVGLARGLGAIDLRVIGQIVIAWLVTLPAGATLAVIFYMLLQMIFI